MTIGCCPCCGCEMFKRKNDILMRPLGNYRSIVFEKEDGSSLEVPMCMECHDSFEDSKLIDIPEKLYNFIKLARPEEADNYKNLKFKAYIKKGSLKSREIQGGVRVWM